MWARSASALRRLEVQMQQAIIAYGHAQSVKNDTFYIYSPTKAVLKFFLSENSAQ